MKALAFSILLCTFSLFLIGQPSSEYNGNSIDANTQKVIDSLVNFRYSYKRRFLSIGQPTVNQKDQNHYWNSHKAEIPEKDFFDLINHKSPVIRYYAYSHIIKNQLTSSKVEFLLNHLEDVEKIRYSNYRSSLMARPDKHELKPLILYILIHSELSQIEQETMAKAIIDLQLDNKDMMDYALDHLELNEENYSLIKSVANDNKNNKAIALLAEYQNEDDQDFLSTKLSSIYKNNKYEENKRFVKFAIENDFPIGSSDLFIAAHQNAKKSNQLSASIRRNSEFYKLITKYDKEHRENILLDLLSAADKDSLTRKKNFYQIHLIIKEVSPKELLDFRIKFWEKGGRLKCASYDHVKRLDSELAFRLAKRDLDLLEKDELHKFGCIRRFAEEMEENNLSSEKYINWGLQVSDGYLRLNAIKTSAYYPYPSAKKYILNLLGPGYKEYEHPNIIRTLSKHSLDTDEKEKIRKWFKERRYKKEYRDEIYKLKKTILEMGIDV